MRLTIPITGTVIVEGSVWGEGVLTGDDADPIRPINLNLRNVSWKMIDVDMENEVMIIEVEPSHIVDELTGEKDIIGTEISVPRPATAAEQAGFLEDVKDLLTKNSKETLITMSGNAKLKRPFNVIE